MGSSTFWPSSTAFTDFRQSSSGSTMSAKDTRYLNVWCLRKGRYRNGSMVVSTTDSTTPKNWSPKFSGATYRQNSKASQPSPPEVESTSRIEILVKIPRFTSRVNAINKKVAFVGGNMKKPLTYLVKEKIIRLQK